MNNFIKFMLITIGVIFPIGEGYIIGTTFDDYCRYGQTIYLGSDKPPRCLTQTEHDELFTGEFWENLENQEIQINESEKHE